MQGEWKEFICFTVKPGNGPVASDAGGERRQLEDERPHVGVGVRIRSRDVDPGVGTRAIAHLSLPGDQHRRVVVHVDQIDLDRSCSTGGRRAWRETVRTKTGDRVQSQRRRDGGHHRGGGGGGDEWRWSTDKEDGNTDVIPEDPPRKQEKETCGE